MKIKVVLLDNDAKYLNKITMALTAKYPDKVEMHSFTDAESAIECLVKDRVDVFVAADFFDIDPETIPPKCAFAYFVDSEDVETLADYKTICRFQKIDVIFNRIQKVYLEKSAAIISSVDDGESVNVKVVNFIAASGGVGCSVAAAAFAVKCAKLGKKVLYLNLDCFSSADLYFRGEGNGNFGNMIYYLKSKKVNLALKHDGIVKRDENGVEFYSATNLALDMKELSLDELRELIAQLKTWGEYDYIVLDGLLELNSNYTSFLNTCSMIVLITDGSETSNFKTKRAIESISVLQQQSEVNVLSKFGILYNRFSTKTSSKIDLDNINEFGGIKRYEGFSQVSQLVAQVVKDSKAFDNII
ncbi:MAG: AAA family ATPase [Clostridia bacterium]|nr:AAA family ATPase [Clostridia bacterium]